MDYIVHGILQARILEWVAFHFSRGSSQLRDQAWEDPGLLHCRQMLYQLSHRGSQMKGQDKNPRKTTKGSGDRQPPSKRIQNNDSEDDPGSSEKNGGKD